MAYKRVQHIRDFNPLSSQFQGLQGELTVDLTYGALRVHDGATPGGNFIPPQSFNDARYQGLDGSLTSISSLGSFGLLVKNMAGSVLSRTLTSLGSIAITNPAGIAGNPILDLAGLITAGSYDGFSYNASGQITAKLSPAVISLNAASLPAFPTNTLDVIANADGSGSYKLIDAFAANGALIFRRADTTAAAPSAVQANQLIGAISAIGYGATSYSGNRAVIGMYASENWTDAAQGTYIGISTTLAGSLTANTIMQIGPTNVSVATPTFGDSSQTIATTAFVQAAVTGTGPPRINALVAAMSWQLYGGL